MKLAQQGSVLEKNIKDEETKVNLEGWFESEQDQCMQALKQLFVTRINENRERRLAKNKSLSMISGISRVQWIRHIFVFMSLDDCLQLGATCVYFNSLVRSPIFLKFVVRFHEKTKIDVSLGAFASPQKQDLSRTSITRKSELREDKEAELETLRSVKSFLTDKLKQNE